MTKKTDIMVVRRILSLLFPNPFCFLIRVPFHLFVSESSLLSFPCIEFTTFLHDWESGCLLLVTNPSFLRSGTKPHLSYWRSAFAPHFSLIFVLISSSFREHFRQWVSLEKNDIILSFESSELHLSQKRWMK